MLRKQKSIDSFCRKEGGPKEFSDYRLARFIQKNKNSSLIFLRQGKAKTFKTESLNVHFLKNERQPNFNSLDGFLTYRKIEYVKTRKIESNYRDYYLQIKERYSDWQNYIQDIFDGNAHGVSMVKMWNVSIVCSLVFGMFLMTFIYRYLGPRASAVSNKSMPAEVLGVSAEKEVDSNENEEKNYEDYVAKIMREYQEDSENEKKLKDDIAEMVEGYPIEKMVPFIAKQDRITAAFLVAIARKESAWGKRVPVLDGEDCFNYWGYRGIRERMGTGGHTCFNSPKDAVETVAKRINSLVNNEKLNTPEKMVVWKCGYDCSWDNPSAVRKWVQDVDYYFEKFDKI